MQLPRACTPLLLCLLTLLCAPLARGQRPTPTPDETEEVIRLDTELIQVRAVVTDGKGRPVDGLTQDDFEVFEDGQPQPISFFSVERAPGSSDPPAAGTAVRAKGAAPARTVVLFVDTLHLSPVRSDARGTEAGGRLRLGLPPGLYTLRLTARDARSKKKATQTVDFEVVP